MRALKIAILGTRGIPNHYGGYEQAAGFIAAGLAGRGHKVTVYNPHNHPYTGQDWNGVDIARCYDPETKIGTVGQFIYDFNCIRHARKRNFDVILFMGYTSSSAWSRFYPRKAVIISNMDGLEWKRSKYSKPVRRFLRLAEKWAIRHSDFYVADSPGIREYLYAQYQVDSCYIPYGAIIYDNESPDILNRFGISPGNYYLLIARMESENNIETILNGFTASGSDKKFMAIGNIKTSYGKRILEKFSAHPNILFPGSIYDQQVLHSLKRFCKLYFHGHSVGGTNPSLLEAMASGALICAHDNIFNRYVLGPDALYFAASAGVSTILQYPAEDEWTRQSIQHNLEKIRSQYNWEHIIEAYESFIAECYRKKLHA